MRLVAYCAEAMPRVQSHVLCQLLQSRRTAQVAVLWQLPNTPQEAPHQGRTHGLEDQGPAAVPWGQGNQYQIMRR